MRTLLAHPLVALLAAAAALLLIAAALWWWRRRPRDPEEVERRRREYLSRVGRIVEGEILEIRESSDAPPPLSAGRSRPHAPNGNGKRSLVCYTYAISGVTYETAQDVTGFEERACLNQLISGQPASVKYDPQSPGNSMLIAEDWSGLH
ncbi:MAG TPA: DUF3592 domain-containing protein [Candidatus Acidoferrales bacterium]|nr:DUF3592 domain-containing protein [Candidatus Acidoferrales bacterium]